ncbi:YhgE/Pip family protein [Hominibacterium faecale]|uniref:YhgE/Pip family protein n=1 Tax=Hominibacterium faecale TaxID=2839743 RepID=UPI0022B29221
MKNILRIFLRDVNRLRTNVIAIVVIVGMCVIPALYAWFNIAVNWDPYGSTSGIQVAVVSLDEGTEMEKVHINAGQQIIKNLRANDDIGWQFLTSEKEAMEKVESGEYYAAIIVPADFSRNMVSIFTSHVERPQFDYYINEKKNAIAPKITDKGATAIQTQIDETFISIVTQAAAQLFDTVSGTLEADGGPMDKLVQSFRDAEQDLDGFVHTIDAFSQTTAGIQSLVKTTQATLPDVQALIKDGKTTATDVQALLLSSKQVARETVKALDDIFAAAQTGYNDLADTLDSAAAQAETSSAKAADALLKLSDQVQNIVEINDTCIQLLQNLNQELPQPSSELSALVKQLQAANDANRQLIKEIPPLAQEVRSSGKMTNAAQKKLRSSIDSALAKQTKIRSDYRTKVQPKLNKVISSIYDSLTDFSQLLTGASTGVANIHQVLDGVDDTLSGGKNALDSTKKVIDGAKNKLEKAAVSLENVGSDERVKKLMDILKTDPELMGDFMSSPVKIDTHTLYPIKNYGSAMAPFYSILAIWVGGIVLVAIMKTQVSEDHERLRRIRPYQAYFGRYILFMVLGLVQATIICLGDLFYLQIQCEHPFLFLLAGWTSSIIFVNIIYTLTISFGDIGKALCVILLVIQIGGAGGTFPIEVTPQFFQNLYPFLPFTYGINAMRECIAGVYGMNYWLDLLRLFAFVPFSLLLGLVLRKPLVRLNRFFNKRIEDTELM